jgi:hypothetical protein
MPDHLPYPARIDGPPPIAEGWPEPPGGWPATPLISTALISDADGASTKATKAWPTYSPPPPSGRPKHLALILSLVAGVVMIGVIGAATTAAIVATRDYRHSKLQATVGMDTPVRDGAFQFTADGVRCGVHEIGTPDDYQSPTGQFCVVTLTIKNVGTTPAIFADAIQKAYGAGNVWFSSDSEAGFYANPDPAVFLNDINPGNKVQVEVVYDIPPAGRILRLEVHENPTTKGAIIRLS